MTDQVDNLIAEWGERLYYRPVQSRPAKKSNSGLLIAAAIASRNFQARASRVRTIAALTSKKVTEVVVKISGSSRGMNKVSAHLEYISRNGKVELENETGDKISSREGVRDLCDEWKNGLYGIPAEGTKREAFHIVLSMPPGTDRIQVKAAAAEFAQHQFGENHQFVFAAHDDERHPHVHLCVKSLGLDGTRLNPRKADLQNWREQFAERLRSHGIDANATPRFARGHNKNPARQKDIHMAERGSIQASIREKVVSSIGLDAATKAYRGLAQALARTGASSDRQLAVEIVNFVGEMHGLEISRDRQKAIPKSTDSTISCKPGRGQEGLERE
jgi:hypothetical protein